MTVSAADAAREVRSRLHGVPVLKLHKLLYLAQGHHLAFFGKPLFDESVSAWDNGPVVAKLWWREDRGEPTPSAVELDEGRLNTLGYVLSRYGRLTGRDLIVLTHGQDPWRLANRDRRPGGTAPISTDAMRSYFLGDREDSDERRATDDDALRAWLVTSTHDAGPSGRFDSIEEIRKRMLDAS